MLKKSKVVALLVVCMMMFAVVEPACARTWGEFFGQTVLGGVMGAAAVVLTGGAALPLVIGGAAVGTVVGALPEKERDELGELMEAAGYLNDAIEIYNDLNNQPQATPQY